ncbi:Phosphoglucosamine mutase [hydrothermal vent metagenome]|uniref:Phosphoglucosamine mutase n=1 Tax=hydrothermal vent metagenome TaxID=652676 RepID=A0A3B1AKZ3_9ZZZZ
MTKKYFGTDGIRGRVGKHPITPDFMLKLGWAVGRVLAKCDNAKVLIGKDTRISGYMFESALEAGLSSAGVDIHLLGPMPTPGIAYLTRTLSAQAGIVISASHNPFDDNGIKFFSSEGIKLDDAVEHAIEAELEKSIETNNSANLGKAIRIEDAAGRYIEFCKSTYRAKKKLNGLKIVVDCANGATYHIAPHVLMELGAEVVSMGNEPDGLNINLACGATDTERLQTIVKAHKADLGIALDGDGDRLIMVDRHGQQVDGDEILFVIAQDRKQQGLLTGGVVGTSMSNLGLEHALAKLNIDFKRANVGDRYVLEMLHQNDWQLGGESSGHIICLDQTTTGDGIISALQVLSAMVNSEKDLHELLEGMDKYPQHMINVRLEERFNPDESEKVQLAVKQAETELRDTGRVLLRPSGTEPVIRVMVEGQDNSQVLILAEKLAGVVSSALN